MRSLANAYASTYDEMLRALVTSEVLNRRTDYGAMWPARGAAFDGDLMVIGRATHGWSATWRAGTAAREAARRRVVERARSASEPPNGCAMSWVSDCWGTRLGEYSAKRSAFWRTVRAVIEGNENSSWPSTLCWSNLYKVAPAVGGNPSAPQRDAMFSYATKLIALEVATFRPRRVLLLTGRSWFEPFAEALGVPVVWGEVPLSKESRGSRA